jgi:hypothetical protein
MKKIYRQGDVLLIETTLPRGAIRKPLEEPHRVVLAHGEVTGHAHAIHDVEHAIRFEASGLSFLQVLQEVSLKHEEHEHITLPAGVYQLLIQTEYSPEELRNVQD